VRGEEKFGEWKGKKGYVLEFFLQRGELLKKFL